MAAPRRSAAPERSRIESDALGRLAVPADALYGIRTQRAVANLSFSGHQLGRCPAFVRALAIVKKAAARANRDAREIDQRRLAAIEYACDEIIRGEHLDQFPVDLLAGGGSIAVNMNVNEVIANLANDRLGGERGKYEHVDPKAHVNASQSTADVCHTAGRIAILGQWADLRRALVDCAGVFASKADELRPVMTISRTCLQDASPVSLGELFGGHAAALMRRISELDQRMQRLRKINLGGTVIGSGEGASAVYRRSILKHLRKIAVGKLTPRENLYDAAQNIDDLGMIAALLGLLAEVFIKIAEDLRLLSSGPEGGFGEIVLPAVQEGSSFFPGKINPVIPETMLQCCFQIVGCERVVRLALERGELHLNVFEGAAVANILDAIEMMRACTTIFAERCVKGITANEDRCRELVATARFKAGKEKSIERG